MKRGGPNHPKTYAFAEALGIRRPQAIGTLELLFHFTAQYAPEGDVGRFDDKRIAAAMDWCGSVQKLIDALIATRWLDRHPVARLVVHDWSDHADRAVLQRLDRRGKKPIQSSQSVTDKVCTQIETALIEQRAMPEPVPEPEPEPEPVPEPGAISRSRRTSTAIDLDSDGPADFEQCYARYGELTGARLRKMPALHVWERLREAGLIDMRAIAECLENYGDSKQVADGVVANFDKWLEEQSRDKWRGRWPRRRPAASQNSRQQKGVDDLASL